METFSLGEKISLLRIYRGKSQLTFAQELDMDNTQLSKYESGRIVPSLKQLIEIATAGKIHPLYFHENVTPDKFEVLMEDLNYAVLLGRLPGIVKLYLREAIKRMSDFSLINDANQNSGYSFLKTANELLTDIKPSAELKKLFKKRKPREKLRKE